jgi:uncharacterized protein (TIRG00374 family)
MNSKQIIGWIIGLLMGGVFVWLSLKSIDINHVWELLKGVHLFWIIPFSFFTITANAIRAMRWRMILDPEKTVQVRTFFGATFFGYVMNIVVPRLGEVSRCGYLSKKTNLTFGQAIATVVIERTVDVLSLLVLMAVTFGLVIVEPEIIENVLGINAQTLYTIMTVTLGLIVVAVGGFLILHRMRSRLKGMEESLTIHVPFFSKLVYLLRQIFNGFLSVREIKNWPLFLFYTVAMWTCYVGMSFAPFWAITDPILNELSFAAAFDVMVISSIGVVIPSPSGIGTYHFFTQQALNLLHNVPLDVALTYAVATHAIMVLSILIFTPIVIALDNFHIKKNKD